MFRTCFTCLRPNSVASSYRIAPTSDLIGMRVVEQVRNLFLNGATWDRLVNIRWAGNEPKFDGSRVQSTQLTNRHQQTYIHKKYITIFTIHMLESCCKCRSLRPVMSQNDISMSEVLLYELERIDKYQVMRSLRSMTGKEFVCG